MVLSLTDKFKVQCPQSNCSSQEVEFIKIDKQSFEYYKCMKCNLRFALWGILGLQVLKK